MGVPKYDEMPRWGLQDRPVVASDEPESRMQRWAGAAPGLLMLTAALLGLAVVAEAVRYGILLYNRTRLVDPTALVISDALVLFAEVASLVMGIGAAVASGCWLVCRRRALFSDAGLRDPRRPRSMLLGCLVPGVSLLMPGVFLTELLNLRGGPDRRRLQRTVRIWWAAWVFDWFLVVVALLWRLRSSLQAEADGVLLTAFVALVGACVALLTVHVMRGVDGLRWRGGRRAEPKRWVVAVGHDTAAPRDEHEKASAS